MFATKLEKGLKRYAGKRKHVSQMSQHEIKGLTDRLKRLSSSGNLQFTRHAFDRMDEKGIMVTQRDIVSMISNSSVVEYKIDKDAMSEGFCERLVIRSRATVNKNYNLKVVFNLTNRTVVTVWINHVKDYHCTLDLGMYDKNMKIFGI